MNDYILTMDHYNGVKEVKQKELKELEDQFNRVYAGCENYKEKIAAKKANEEILDRIAAEMSKKQNDIKILDNCIKVIQEMIAKETANDIIKAIKEGKKNLVNTPRHYKKFKAAVDEVLNGRGGYLTGTYYTVTYSTPYYNPAGNQDIYICTTTDQGGPITDADAEKIQLYKLIPANEILNAVKKAMEAKKKIDEIEKEAKQKISDIREEINDSTILVNITK